MCRQPTQLFFLPVNIQFQPIHVPHDDYDRNLGPLGETSLSSLITSSAGTSGCTGLKRKLSPEAIVNAQNEKSEFISSPRYFTRPSVDNLKSFFEFHPHQPRANVPFNTERAYFRIDANGEKVHRQWLTYESEQRTMRCSICIAFGKSSDSIFSCDVDDKKTLLYEDQRTRTVQNPLS